MSAAEPDGPAREDSADDQTLDLGLVGEVEEASLTGWPASVLEHQPDGWLLRATPGVDRGRSCYARTPSDRRLARGELGPALDRVRTFSARHGIRGGVQVSPLELHEEVIPGLAIAGWTPGKRVQVMVAERAEVLDAFVPGAPWRAVRGPDPTWLQAWRGCEPRNAPEAITAHADTVFAEMGERGVFGRVGELATGIAVEDPVRHWAGLFSLVVREDARGGGLGRRLLLGLVHAVAAPRLYLQVIEDNRAAIGLYKSVGFRHLYSYCHVMAPEGWSGASGGAAGLPGPTAPARQG